MARILVSAERTVNAPADAVSTAWDGAGGIGGVFERLFAPRVLRVLYTDELQRLDAYAREHRPT